MITIEQARQAIEDMDDLARMNVGVNPIGPRQVLEQYVKENIALVEGIGEWIAYEFEKCSSVEEVDRFSKTLFMMDALVEKNLKCK